MVTQVACKVNVNTIWIPIVLSNWLSSQSDITLGEKQYNLYFTGNLYWLNQPINFYSVSTVSLY